MIGRLLDEFVRPEFIQNTRPTQNPNQYGFTAGLSYLLAGLQRHEVEAFCIDQKKTLFTCSLDGDSAFEVINREIQSRELFCSKSEAGEFWRASHFEYKDTKTKIKLNGQLSGEIEEQRGCKQGNLKSGDHYKVYVPPPLEMLDAARK